MITPFNIKKINELYSNISYTTDEKAFDSNGNEIVIDFSLVETEVQKTQYQIDRSAEYPPITDYLDGVVKGDQAQIEKYIADCQAVKAKYPKGS